MADILPHPAVDDVSAPLSRPTSYLEDEGVICVSIDDFERHHLRLVMNEIFGEENFIAQLVVEKGRKNDAKLFSVGHEYVVIYATVEGWLCRRAKNRLA